MPAINGDSVWKGKDEPHSQHTANHFKDIEITKIPRPKVEDIRKACKSFPIGTAVVDGIHPRHIAELPDAAIEFLADLFEIWELCGNPMVPEQTLIVKMLPKPTGGYRPIGLFPCLYRIWGKTRQPIIRQWALENIPDAEINMAPGRWTGDATWRQGTLLA